MGEESFPKLLFPYGFDEGIAFEAEMKGFYYYAVVQLSSTERVRVGFYDAFTVAQDLERGSACVAIPGMIVLPKVTLEHMEKAVKLLSEGDFFYELLSLGAAVSEQDQRTAAGPHRLTY